MKNAFLISPCLYIGIQDFSTVPTFMSSLLYFIKTNQWNKENWEKQDKEKNKNEYSYFTELLFISGRTYKIAIVTVNIFDSFSSSFKGINVSLICVFDVHSLLGNSLLLHHMCLTSIAHWLSHCYLKIFSWLSLRLSRYGLTILWLHLWRRLPVPWLLLLFFHFSFH